MSIFKFKHFDLKQSDSPMKVGTDAMLLGAFADVKGKTIGLDVGAGTGVLSLMCAQRNPNLSITAVELDELASNESRTNFECSSFSGQLEAIHTDFLEFETEKNFDIIISNPPYYQSRLENSNQRKSKARHESSLPKSKFIGKVARLLTQEGEFWLIIPFEDAKGWEYELNAVGLYVNYRIDIYGKVGGVLVRSILRCARVETVINVQKFTIRNEDSSYTGEYIELTKEYHFKSLKKKEA